MPDEVPELPGMPEAKSPRKGSFAWIGTEFRRFRELARKHDGLTTPIFASELLGVSRQRVHQLMDDGKLPSIEIMNKRWLPCDQLYEFFELERGNGFRYSRAEIAA